MSKLTLHCLTKPSPFTFLLLNKGTSPYIHIHYSLSRLYFCLFLYYGPFKRCLFDAIGIAFWFWCGTISIGGALAPVPAYPPSSPPTIPSANAPTAHRPMSHAPRHSLYSPAHAPSPIKTPSAAALSSVVHFAPTKSPVVAKPPSSISMPPSDAPAPAKNAAVFNRFSTAGSVAVGVFAAVFIM
ncbi:hypothetical protein CRYUN_Cryun06bG0068900 [Craigia yunnanensis]